MDTEPPPQPIRDSALPSDALPESALPLSTGVVTATPSEPEYHDRGTGLIIFGVFQIILGLLAALMVPLMGLGAFMSRLNPAGGMRPGQLISGVATYTLIAAALLALGIGSVQMKRWARAITLVTSWYWLITGSLITVLITAMLPVTMRNALAQAQRSAPGGPSAAATTGVMAVVLTLVIIFAAVFLVVVPIAFVVFYSRKDVAETVRHRDPVERWTDKTPLPVLGASIIFAVGALYLLLMGVTTPVFPLFGRFVSGIAGAACFVGVAIIDVYLAIALFRLQPFGWWLAVFAVPIRLVSMGLTYARADMMQAYSKMGMSESQLQMLRSNPMFRGNILLWWGLVSMVALFGYLVWLKRYFNMRASTLTRPDPPAPEIG